MFCVGSLSCAIRSGGVPCKTVRSFSSSQGAHVEPAMAEACQRHAADPDETTVDQSKTQSKGYSHRIFHLTQTIHTALPRTNGATYMSRSESANRDSHTLAAPKATASASSQLMRCFQCRRFVMVLTTPQTTPPSPEQNRAASPDPPGDPYPRKASRHHPPGK